MPYRPGAAVARLDTRPYLEALWMSLWSTPILTSLRMRSRWVLRRRGDFRVLICSARRKLWRLGRWRINNSRPVSRRSSVFMACPAPTVPRCCSIPMSSRWPASHQRRSTADGIQVAAVGCLCRGRWRLIPGGGLTERPLAAASWIVLTPFMLYNVAFFMLPAGGAKAGLHRWARRIMRLLALAGTAQFVNGAVIVLVSTIGWQNAALRSSNWWIGWYTRLAAGPRVGLALTAVGVIVSGLWLASVRTAHRYEKREMSVSAGGDHDWEQRKPGFWHGATVVTKQRNLPVGA